MDYDNGKVRKRRKRSLVNDLFKEFNANSTLHGLKYFTENDISLIERLFWIVTFLLSLGLCCSLIYNVWMKWQESPVIVSFSERMIPVWQVPFPAFTICPRTKTQYFVYNFTENYYKFRNGSSDKSYNTSRFREQLDNVALVCGSGLRDRFTDRDFCNHTSVLDMIQVAPEVNDVFRTCRWRGNKKNCSDMFKKLVTFHGICYNFNGLSSKDIFDEER